MADTEFLAFADDPTANVVSQAEYEAAPFVGVGRGSGILPSNVYNKIARQPAWVAHCLTALMAAALNEDILDDANQNTFIDQLRRTLLTLTPTIVGSSRNLRFVNASTTVANMTADEVAVETEFGGTVYKVTGVNLALNLAITGPGGMDVGLAPISNDIYIYLILDPNTGNAALLATTQGAGSQIYSGANMPAGYLASALVSSLKTDGARHYQNFFQTQRQIFVQNTNFVGVGGAGGFVSLASCVPFNALVASGYITAPIGQTMVVGADANAVGSSVVGGGATNPVLGTWNVPLKTAQAVYLSTSGGVGTLSVSGYQI